MDNQDLQRYIDEKSLDAKILTMSGRVHSVEAASNELGVPPDHIIKTVVFIGSEENAILAIVKGTDRASSKRIGKALNIDIPRLATPEEALQLTEYEVGGTPPISIRNGIVLIDPRVMEMESVVGGGGSDYHLLRISPSEILQATAGRIIRIRK
jgi:prolyl-tRNA editing enzyme YbaK/EbsC (Cys-tRNA(Pro) deacylase)